MLRGKGKNSIFILLALNAFLIEEAMRIGISSLLFREGEIDRMRESLTLNPFDSEHRFRLAMLSYILLLGGKEMVEALYLGSLESNPLLVSSWLGLSETLVEAGEEEKARTALSRALSLSPSSTAVLWEGSILALRLGDTDLALKNLRVVADTDPGRRRKAFDLSWQFIGDPEVILREVVTDRILPDYLRYLISRDKLDETFPVWERMKGAGMVSKDAALGYIDFLIRRERGHLAISIWKEVFGENEGDTLIWNGGFENEPLGRGFDWRIGSTEGVAVDFDWEKRFQGRYSLRLTFDGKHNTDFHHVSQVVPVEPDTDYILTSRISTRGITTRNGISWEVYCYPRGKMSVATEPLTGTTEWRTVGLRFHTPSDCTSIMVRLRRYASTRLDRYISGTAWVDDVRLLKGGEG
jgi:hypothetical protein